MILFDLAETETHPAYQAMAAANLERQFSFLRSLVEAAIATRQRFLSETILKALNFQAIVGLEATQGEYRRDGMLIGDTPAPPGLSRSGAHGRLHQFGEQGLGRGQRS